MVKQGTEMTKLEAYLTTIYGAAISGKSSADLPPESDGEALLNLANKHGVAETLYHGLKGTAFEGLFEEHHANAVERERIRSEEESRVFSALEGADVSFLPLKGSVMGLYYPYYERRGLADTDIMVDTFARKDVRAVMEGLSYRLLETKSNSDIYTFESSNVIQIYYKPRDGSDFHKKLMEKAVPAEEHSGRLSLSFSDYYVYIISDMAMGMRNGKVNLGIVGDIKGFYARFGSKLDAPYVEDTLEKMGLLTFEAELKKLIYLLFYGEKGSNLSTRFANYIFSFGVADTKEQNKENKELFKKLGLANVKNGKQRMTGGDVALSLVVITVLVFAIGFISTAFFQKVSTRFDPPEFSVDGEQSEEEISGDGLFVPPEQNYATIPYRNGVYKGYVSDGLPNGAGELSLPNGEKYIGSFSAGQFNGNGIYYYLNGSTFDGMWFEGEINGTGTLSFVDGSYIHGDFINGTPQGVCVFQNANGDVYEGELKDGKKTGKGRFSWVNGDIYEGDYVDGEREGYGKYVNCDGSSYEGEWVASVPNGEGTMITTDKVTLSGVFIEGVLEGEGKSVSKNGNTYEGYFIHGKCWDDKAVYTFSDGSKYEGAFENDLFNGKGKFTYADGDVVTGTFKDGLLQGSATYYDKATGRTRYVTYKNGKPV